MSWQVKDTTSEINRLRNDLNKIRDQLFISSFSTGLPSSSLIGGATGQGTPIGGGNQVGLMAIQVDANVQITDVDTSGTSTGIFDKIDISSSNMIITTGGGSNNVKFIQGTLNDGQFIILKAQIGVTKTLKTGGNINISSDITFSDTELIVAIFYEEQTSPDSNGSYVIHKLSTAGAGAFYQTIQDAGVAETQRPIFNFTGTGVTVADDAGNNRTNINITSGVAGEFFGPWTAPHTAGIFSLIDLDFITFFSPLGAIGIQRAGVGPVGLEYEALASGAHDFFVNRGVVGFPIVGITQTGVFVNFPITMANPGNRNIFMGLDGNIVDLADINQMKDLFFNTSGTAFTNSRQIFGTAIGLDINVPSGQRLFLDFNGSAEWSFSNMALLGANPFSSITLQSFFLLAPQLFDPLFDGEFRNVSGDLKAASGGLIFDFTKANPTAMGQDIVFPGASGFTIDFDGSNIALSATAGFQTLPAQPLLFLIVKLGGATVKIPVYSP